MSFAIGHFAVGAAAMTLVVGVVAPRFRFKGTLIVLSGLWAMVPDAYLAAPNHLEWLEAIHNSSQANLFWFHRALDVADPTDSPGFAARLVVVWLVVTVAVELADYLWTELAKRYANGATAHDSSVRTDDRL